jgi:hypothetical protein
MTIILAAQDQEDPAILEIKRIAVQSQWGKILQETLS